MRKLVVWHNLNKDTYYYKIVSGFYNTYYPGYVNGYNHKIILVVENLSFTSIKKEPLKKRLIRRLIRFLENKLNK